MDQISSISEFDPLRRAASFKKLNLLCPSLSWRAASRRCSPEMRSSPGSSREGHAIAVPGHCARADRWLSCYWSFSSWTRSQPPPLPSHAFSSPFEAASPLLPGPGEPAPEMHRFRPTASRSARRVAGRGSKWVDELRTTFQIPLGRRPGQRVEKTKQEETTEWTMKAAHHHRQSPTPSRSFRSRSSFISSPLWTP